jgi:hypothetical protein
LVKPTPPGILGTHWIDPTPFFLNQWIARGRRCEEIGPVQRSIVLCHFRCLQRGIFKKRLRRSATTDESDK